MKRMTAEEKNEIKRMLMHGLRGWEIEEKTGRNAPTINKIRKELQDEGFQIWHTKGGVIASTLY